MRILQVNSARQLGGGETHVIELTEELRKRGHDVLVAGRSGSPINPQIELPFRNSIDMLTSLRLRKVLQDERFDIVHAHVARDYPVVAAACRGLPLKLVMTRHLLYPVHRSILYDRTDGWIAPTTQIMETLAPLRPKKSAVIPNWVNLEKFSFVPHAVHRPVNLGLLGQISPHKGHDDAIEALRILGDGYRLLIAGKGEPDYVQALKTRSQGLPAEFLGFVSLPTFFEHADILLVPSWEEPFGIVLLEAMASGIPVIATAAGGPLDIIRSGIDGILVPAKSPQMLADAVKRLDRESVVKNARERVEAEFDIRKVVPRIEAFYQALRSN